MKSSKLPVQAAPIERTIVGAAMSSGDGVDPSFDWGGLLGGIAKAAIPVIAGAI